MNRFSKAFIFSICTVLLTSGIAMAETKFTPLNFDDTTTPTAPATTTSTTVSGVTAKGTDLLDPSQVTGGTKMQNAILQIDNAQIEVRNKLLNYRTNYSEIDARYDAVKAERKAAKKQITQAERKIKNLEKAKNKIRKNFERKSNI
ncbi:hypothetical protein IJ579_05180 [bacterium]|nr:hypothetical protein [bacterium]